MTIYKKLLKELVDMTEKNEIKAMELLEPVCMIIHPKSDFINRVRREIGQ